jgi:peptidoglycan/xylan/chitin deacetylase (PgdA/CDA1 family)
MNASPAHTRHCANASQIAILTYHQIAPAPAKGAAFRSLYVSQQRFRQQMNWLRRLGYRGVSMSELMPYLRGERQGRVVGITLDDGYRNNLEAALPVLQAVGFTATCYVVSGLMGRSNEWDHAIGIEPADLMSASEVRAWAEAGMEVGSHTRHHVHLNESSDRVVRDELRGSRQDLEDLLGRPVLQFCYPFGHYRPEQAHEVLSAGYEAATTTHRGQVFEGDDLFQLHRIPVVRSTYWPQFLLKVLTGYENKYRASEVPAGV